MKKPNYLNDIFFRQNLNLIKRKLVINTYIANYLQLHHTKASMQGILNFLSTNSQRTTNIIQNKNYQCTNHSTHVGNPKMLGFWLLQSRLKIWKCLKSYPFWYERHHKDSRILLAQPHLQTHWIFINSNLVLHAPSR